jgi:tRNA (guanine-N7-)-methyltransferase
MDFAWEELNEQQRTQAYADWSAGRGLIGGDPRLRPDSSRMPVWGLNRPFFRTLALGDPGSDAGSHLQRLIQSERPIEVEIGFGRGDFLLDRATRHPQTIFVGYETQTRATRLAVERVVRMDLPNVWLSDDDARFGLARVFTHGRLSVIHILFPDPWWKTQHKVKRLFSPPFVDLLATLLGSGGILHFRSDVQEYGELVRYLVEQHPAFGTSDAALASKLGDGAPTHREQWCLLHDRPVWTHLFERNEIELTADWQAERA